MTTLYDRIRRVTGVPELPIVIGNKSAVDFGKNDPDAWKSLTHLNPPAMHPLWVECEVDTSLQPILPQSWGATLWYSEEGAGPLALAGSMRDFFALKLNVPADKLPFHPSIYDCTDVKWLLLVTLSFEFKRHHPLIGEYTNILRIRTDGSVMANQVPGFFSGNGYLDRMHARFMPHHTQPGEEGPNGPDLLNEFVYPLLNPVLHVVSLLNDGKIGLTQHIPADKLSRASVRKYRVPLTAYFTASPA